MAIRENSAMGFVDVVMGDLGGPRSAALLEKLDAATPWQELAAPIRRLGEYQRGGPGRPAWDPVVMLKCLMLAKWYNLSDPGLEEQLKDRISFRRFVGLSFTDATPDETTFVRFRTRLREMGLHDTIFQAVLRHIESQGLLIKQGTLVDATVIEAPRGRPRPDGTHTRDPEASFTYRHGKPHHGYKGHIACDRSAIVTGYRFGTAREHDSDYIDELVENERVLVVADSAYSSQARRERLKRRGVIAAICYKRVRGQAALDPWQEQWNRSVSPIRAIVEHPNAMMKEQCGYRRVRYRGRARNAFDFAMTLTACNIKRSLSLQPRQQAA
jgi:transposase, IS5 family